MGGFDEGEEVFKKNHWMGESCPAPPCPLTVGNPASISCYQNMHVNYFFIIFTLKIKESQCFCLIFLMLTLKKFYFVYVICMHVISQPLYIVCPSEMWTFASWGTEVANSFFPCMARLRNSVPAYCFPLSYNLDLLKDNISMHLASLSITWKPTNKNIGNFIIYPNLY